MNNNYFSEAVNDGLKAQKLNTTIKDCPVNITLKSGVVLNTCFIEKETTNLLVVSETTKELTEEIRVVAKDDISYLAVVYLTPDLMENTIVRENNMYM